MLALADWCDDDKGQCFPSIATIAKRIRLSRAQTQRVLHQLIDHGFLKVIANERGGPPGSTCKYQIQMDRLTGRTTDTPTGCVDATGTGVADATPTGRTDATGSAGATGSTHASDGSHPCAETGSAHATQTVSEPSVNHQEGARKRAVSVSRTGNKVRKDECALQEFIDRCKATGEDPICDEDPIFDYAAKVGIDHKMIAVCWQEFKAAYLSSDKRTKDWRAFFRNAVRGNWYRLWYMSDGEPAKWTTQGEQARRAGA
jgi:hypothetical protein